MSVLIRATRVNSEQRLGGAAQELAPPAPYLPPDGRADRPRPILVQDIQLPRQSFR